MRRALPLVLLFACSRGPAPAALTAEHRVAMVDSVTTMLTAWREAVNARDADRIATFYAADPQFRWIEDGAVRYTSREQVAEAYKAMLLSLRAMAMTLDNPAVTPLGPGAALVTTGFAQKVTDTTGAITGFAGMLSMTVVHTDSGWQFLAGHTSSVIPRAPAPTPVQRN